MDLTDLELTNDWLGTIATELNGGAFVRGLSVSYERWSHGSWWEPGRDGSVSVTELRLAGTRITDAALAGVSKLKSLTALDLSRCSQLTDESLTIIRRQLSMLQELHVDECRHFTSTVLVQLWTDCTRLHTLTARGCPGVTDAVLQCIAKARRYSAAFSLQLLDVRQCKHVTSSGVSALAMTANKDMRGVQSLLLGDCLDVDNMAFFGFETSRSLGGLRYLNLCGLRIDETAVSWIAKGCRQLARVNLSRCSTLSDFALLQLAAIVRLPGFTYLNLRECGAITDAGIENLFAEADDQEDGEEDDDEMHGGVLRVGATQLQVLNLKHCVQLSDASLQIIGRRCPQLLKLHLKAVRKISDQGVLSIAKACPSLLSISLSGRHITLQSCKLLGKLCRNLQRIDLSDRLDLQSPGCIASLTNAMRITSAVPSSFLRKVDLSGTNVCDEGVALLAANARELEWLNLSKCARLTDAAVLAVAGNSFQLQVLLLSHTRGLTDQALLALANARLPLTLLNLCGNTNLTDSALLTLCAACPGIRELRLKGCDRLSILAVKHCNRELLPFTRPLQPPSLSQTLATGGGNSTTQLVPLPARHVELLQLMHTQYKHALVLQTKFRKWKAKSMSLVFLSRRRLLRENRAAAKIQRCARAFISWRRFLYAMSLEKNVLKIVMVQAHARGNASRQRTRILQFTLHRAARCIQRGYRPHFIVRMCYRNTNALAIQRVYRGHLGRQTYARAIYARKLVAGARIWHWYRTCKHHRDLRARSQWLMLKIRSIQGQWRKFHARSLFRQHLAFYHTRAIRIQSVWRRVLAAEFVRARRVTYNASALRIQTLYRGFATRQRVTLFRRKANASAVVIQARWRCFAGNRQYRQVRRLIIDSQRKVRYVRTVRRLRVIVRQAVSKHRNDAARCIQRHVRGRRGRKRAVLFRKIRNAKCARKGQNASQAWIRNALMRKGAALRIQRWIRRVQARRSMLRVRKWRQFIAAECLQRYTRAWIRRLRVRRQREAKIHAAINIQRVYRGLLGRRRFRVKWDRRQRKLAARLLQRVYRGHRGRCEFARTKAEKTSAALLLQRSYRGRHTRKLYEISLAVKALKAKEKYDNSLLGKLHALRSPMDELYRRARLPRERAVLMQLKENWEAHRVAEERALRKLKREFQSSIWSEVSDVMGNHASVRHKLYGVSETVYTTHRELAERQALQIALREQLVDLHTRLNQCQQALRGAAQSRRMLEGSEIFEILQSHALFLSPES